MTRLTHLLSPFELGDVELTNRVVMAPMTRSRATGNVPNELMAQYYAQRSGAGLIITEGTAPSPNGVGYPRIPGLYSPEQIHGWRRVTEAVHADGAKIFAQLMHVGRIAHPHNLPEGAEIVAPSAVAAGGEMYTDAEGPLPHPTPRAMDEGDIEAAIEEFVAASRNAIAAGFDGVELHAANGYLLEQFLNPAANRRDDRWGASAADRNRLVLTVAERVAGAIGAGRVGIRLSPYGVFNDVGPFEGIDAQYEALARALGELGLAYVHIVDHEPMGAPEVPESVKRTIGEAFGGPVILSGGYDAASAEADLAAGRGALVAFGRPFLANPDLVSRFLSDAPLNEPEQETFYTPGPKGYVDYPLMAEAAE